MGAEDLMAFQGQDLTPLSDRDYARAATALGCEVATIKAFGHEEGPRGGFIPGDGRPTVLFESHYFHTKTHGLYDDSHPGISTPSWVHNYGAGGAHQWERYYEAAALNEGAALASMSWGKFQIMGDNYNQAGYDTLDAFVGDMCESEGYQLDAFVAFIQNTPGLQVALARKDWDTAARLYNGPGQVTRYAADIAEAYASYV